MVDPNACYMQDNDLRRRFWATQPSIEGSLLVCGAECGKPGLQLVQKDMYESCRRCQTVPGDPIPAESSDTTISTENYIRGLAINILLTNARAPDRTCGYRPGSIGGHWSESYAPSGTQMGNLLHTIPDGYKMSDLLKLVQQYANHSLQKLVTYGVASRVIVTTEYLGNGVVRILADIFGSDGRSERVGLSGTIVENYWVWQA